MMSSSVGASAKIGVTGYEGLLGVSLFLGGHTAPNQAVVQSGGHAYRIGAKLVKHEFEQGGDLAGDRYVRYRIDNN